jgi:two-component system, NarL family, response regulator DegU
MLSSGRPPTANDGEDGDAMARYGVVIVDDQPLYRGGVRAALEAEAELHVIGETAGEPGMLERIAAVQPDAVVIGVNPPQLAGLEVARGLRRRLPRAVLVALLLHLDEPSRRAALEAGFDRVAGKEIAPATLLAHLRDGLAAVRPASGAEPALRALPSVRARRPKDGPLPLSRRENEILHLVAEGQSNKEIAAVLGISDQTVKNNITSMLRKLGVQDRTQAVIHALRHGWIEVRPEPVRFATPFAEEAS